MTNPFLLQETINFENPAKRPAWFSEDAPVDFTQLNIPDSFTDSLPGNFRFKVDYIQCFNELKAGSPFLLVLTGGDDVETDSTPTNCYKVIVTGDGTLETPILALPSGALLPLASLEKLLGSPYFTNYKYKNTFASFCNEVATAFPQCAGVVSADFYQETADTDTSNLAKELLAQPAVASQKFIFKNIA